MVEKISDIEELEDELDELEDDLESENIFDKYNKEEEEKQAIPRYEITERETFAHYDELEDSWTIETNVRKHITKLMKKIDLIEILDQEINPTNGLPAYVRAKVKMDKANVNPMPKAKIKRELTEEQRLAMRERMSKMWKKGSEEDGE
jgi:hypothetical protein